MLTEQPQHISLIKVQCPFPPFKLRQRRVEVRKLPLAAPRLLFASCARPRTVTRTGGHYTDRRSRRSVSSEARTPARTLARTHELSVMNSVCTHTVIHSNILSCTHVFFFFSLSDVSSTFIIFLLISFSFSCRDHFFSFSFILREVRPPCFREVKRFNSCISQTVIFVHCAITFQATSLFCLSSLVHFWAEPRVFYTVSIYNLATIGRRRSQQGIYNDDAGHIGWPFVYECLVRRACSTLGTERRPYTGRPRHISKWSREGRICHVVTI